MKIMTNYATLRSTRDCKKPHFEAKLDKQTLETVKGQAQSSGLSELLEHKVKTLEKWGSEDSVISATASGMKLTNKKASSGFSATLDTNKNDDALYKLLSLNEGDILSAEREITLMSRLAKLDAVQNIVSNPFVMEKVTGQKFPTDKKLEQCISKMSEKELLSYCQNFDDSGEDGFSILDMCF